MGRAKKSDKYRVFYNPAGFAELQYLGDQTPESVITSTNEIVEMCKKLEKDGKPIKILVGVTQIPNIDVSKKMAKARLNAIQSMATTNYDRVAIYGNVTAQIMISTLVLIAGKRSKIKVFSTRAEALGWLKSKI